MIPFLALFCFVVCVQTQGYNVPYQDVNLYEYGEPVYSYAWHVADSYSGNDFGQEESRKGYTTDGTYSVLLPDGRKQIVTYNVADANSGYVVNVRYEGHANQVLSQKPIHLAGNNKHSYQEASKNSYQPIYQQPLYVAPSTHQAKYNAHLSTVKPLGAPHTSTLPTIYRGYPTSNAIPTLPKIITKSPIPEVTKQLRSSTTPLPTTTLAPKRRPKTYPIKSSVGRYHNEISVSTEKNQHFSDSLFYSDIKRKLGSKSKSNKMLY